MSGVVLPLTSEASPAAVHKPTWVRVSVLFVFGLLFPLVPAWALYHHALPDDPWLHHVTDQFFSKRARTSSK